jgi:hypothetical protein
MARRKTDHAADARFGSGYQQSFLLETARGSVRKQGREIVIKNMRSEIFRITDSDSPGVSRAHIAAGIVGRSCFGGVLLDLTEPRPLRAIWRYQNPLAS